VGLLDWLEVHALEAEVARLKAQLQRYADLVRHQRAELHEAGLISDEEYVALLSDSGAVRRLESYDEMRAGIERLRRLILTTAEMVIPTGPDHAYEIGQEQTVANAIIGAFQDKTTEIERLKGERDSLNTKIAEMREQHQTVKHLASGEWRCESCNVSPPCEATLALDALEEALDCMTTPKIHAAQILAKLEGR
jgi:uncharacterized small protein (DUF1192 family)